MKRIIFGILMVALLVGCTQQSTPTPPAPPPAINGPVSLNETNQTGPTTREFSIVADEFTFTPSTISVKRGDKVVLKVLSKDVEHGISIPDFAVNVVLPVNQEKTIEFVADKQGTFDFRCSVFCGSGHSRMRGT